MKVTGIILAAGNSTRFGQNKNKNLFEINGKPIISHSIEAFNATKEVNDIILVIKDEERKYFDDIVKNINLNKPLKFVNGGSSRKSSVYNALCETNCDFVVIHDGARPNVKPEFMGSLLKAMKEYKGATVAVKSKDTIKICDDSQVVTSTTNRQNTWLIQTPQCFDMKVLKQAHEKFERDDTSITDDCMVLEKCGYKIKVIEGDYSNIKVTTYDDMNVIENMKGNY